MSDTRDRTHLRFGSKARRRKGRYVMLMDSEQIQAVLKAIRHCPRPATTLFIWHAITAVVEFDTGMIDASAVELARIAEVPPAEASRALSTLVELGVLQRVSRGRYKVNPHVAWVGNEEVRRMEAEDTDPVPV